MLLHCNIVARLVAVAVLTAGLALPMTAQAADQVYLQEIDDMPLPPGFVEDAGAGVSFDKPEGRIVEAVARGTGSRSTVVEFYRAALPQLGWRVEENSGLQRWRREGETLRLDVAGTPPTITVRFVLAPNQE